MLRLTRSRILSQVSANTATQKTLEFEVQARTQGKFEKLKEGEVIVRVAFFHPHSHQKSQEFLVLGSQKLTDLRDRVLCVNDSIEGADQTPSSCMFIEGMFYDDTRSQQYVPGEMCRNMADPGNLLESASKPLSSAAAIPSDTSADPSKTSVDNAYSEPKQAPLRRYSEVRGTISFMDSLDANVRPPSFEMSVTNALSDNPGLGQARWEIHAARYGFDTLRNAIRHARTAVIKCERKKKILPKSLYTCV